MARQVNTILCNAVGRNSTTYSCLHDQSVSTTGNCLFLCVFQIYLQLVSQVKNVNEEF